jgi:hypothetical protein
MDGLAYISVVHIAKTVSPFAIKKLEMLKASEYLRRCSGTVELLSHINP